jgi:hypothetical protein
MVSHRTVGRCPWQEFYNWRDTVNPGKTHPLCLEKFSMDRRRHVDMLKQLA